MSLVIEENEIDSLPITIDPEILGGVPVFRGTRVPVDALLSNLEAGLSIDEFLENFPTVTREQALQVLEFSRATLHRLTNASRHSLLHSSRNPDARVDLMHEAATDELFLADLNETMEDFGHADQEEENDTLTMERLARKP